MDLRFRIESVDGHTVSVDATLAEAAQEAECLHARYGVVQSVIAAADDEHGLYRAGETVYVSHGADA